MKAIILLERLQVENANAITGMTWGFPGISHFLGFSHALSRQLQIMYGVSLGGCALICHQHQVHAHQPGGREWVFSLTRNPLTREGNTAPFIEEGRMHCTVSLLIECHFDALDLCRNGETPAQAVQLLQTALGSLVPRQRLAGGTIVGHGKLRLIELDADQARRTRDMRRVLLGLLPGFALADRRGLLAEYHRSRQETDSQADLLDSLIDYVALRHRAHIDGEHKVDWQREPRPHGGYLVPLAVGFQAISQLHAPGEVANSRDPSVPFRFVESAYSLGEWLSPHRCRTFNDIAALFWRYQQHDDLYLCSSQPLEVDGAEFEESNF